VVDLLGGPAADMTAMQEDFEQADDAGVVDLDPGIADRADGDRQGEALQQRKVDVDIEPLRGAASAGASEFFDCVNCRFTSTGKHALAPGSWAAHAPQNDEFQVAVGALMAVAPLMPMCSGSPSSEGSPVIGVKGGNPIIMSAAFSAIM
jgi:hypothetical protein